MPPLSFYASNFTVNFVSSKEITFDTECYFTLLNVTKYIFAKKNELNCSYSPSNQLFPTFALKS